MNKKQIGITLAGLRRTSKRKFSISSGMTFTQIQDIEFGRRNYTIGNLLKYLDQVGYEIDFKKKINNS